MEGLHHDTNLDQEDATSGDKEGSSDAENTESSEAVAGNRPEVGGVGEIDYSKEAANRELSPEEKIEFWTKWFGYVGLRSDPSGLTSRAT